MALTKILGSLVQIDKTVMGQFLSVDLKVICSSSGHFKENSTVYILGQEFVKRKRQNHSDSSRVLPKLP
jgi:hypothetical protein